MIFGVCKILGDKVAWNAKAWRLIFVVSLFLSGVGLGVYLILAIIFALNGDI